MRYAAVDTGRHPHDLTTEYLVSVPGRHEPVEVRLREVVDDQFRRGFRVSLKLDDERMVYPRQRGHAYDLSHGHAGSIQGALAEAGYLVNAVVLLKAGAGVSNTATARMTGGFDL